MATNNPNMAENEILATKRTRSHNGNFHFLRFRGIVLPAGKKRKEKRIIQMLHI